MDPCWICSGRTAPDPVLGTFGYSRCTECEFVQRPDETTRALYEGGAFEARAMGAQYVDDTTLWQRRDNARARLRWMLRHLPADGRLLDVGAAGGEFVFEAVRHGFQAEGIEPSPGFARHATGVLRVTVRNLRLEDADLAPAAFSVITLWHVLEHIPDPVTALRRLRPALAPSGHLVVEVPNLASVHAEMLGTTWSHLDPAAHVSQFAPDTLQAALAAAGYESPVCTTVSHAAYLSTFQRLAPRAIASEVKLALRGAPRVEHPTRHEYIRAIAGAAS